LKFHTISAKSGMRMKLNENQFSLMKLIPAITKDHQLREMTSKNIDT